MNNATPSFSFDMRALFWAARVASMGSNAAFGDMSDTTLAHLGHALISQLQPTDQLAVALHFCHCTGHISKSPQAVSRTATRVVLEVNGHLWNREGPATKQLIERKTRAGMLGLLNVRRSSQAYNQIVAWTPVDIKRDFPHFSVRGTDTIDQEVQRALSLYRAQQLHDWVPSSSTMRPAKRRL